jgi:NitT/TauT family transport system ATP-binding protein
LAPKWPFLLQPWHRSCRPIVAIDRPRPRDPFAAEAIALKRELTELLSVEADSAFAEQEGVATAA